VPDDARRSLAPRVVAGRALREIVGRPRRGLQRFLRATGTRCNRVGLRDGLTP